MARSGKIRITKNDKQEYERLVRSAKDKIRRTSQKYGVNLRDEIQLPKLRDITSREEFNKFKEEVKSFTSRYNKKYQFVKNEFGVVASKKEIAEIERNTKRAQRVADKANKEAAKKPFVSGGKEQGTVGQRMKQMAKPSRVTEVSRPPDFNFSKMRSKKQLEEKKKAMSDRGKEGFFDARKAKMKDNFTDLVEKTFNSDANSLVNKLNKLPPNVFYEMYLTHDEFDFDYIYDNGDLDGLIELLENYVDEYFDGTMNTDLMGF